MVVIDRIEILHIVAHATDKTYVTHLPFYMLILSKNNVRYGFLASTFGKISTDNVTIPKEMFISTNSFLYNFEKVGIFNSTDTVYLFHVWFDSNILTKIEFEQTDKTPKEDGNGSIFIKTKHSSSVVDGIYKKIESKYAYDLLEDVKVKKVFFQAKVLWIEGNIIYIFCEEYPIIKSVRFELIVDLFENEVVSKEMYPDSESTIELYMFLRNQLYIPDSIGVYSVKIIKK
jgi:hypothetical protein